MTMVRKQVFITTEQNRLLKLRAKAAKRPEAELIRSAIDRELGIESEKDDWKARIMSTFGALADDEGLEQRIAENRRRWNARLDDIRRKLNDDE
jgi:hypothetical protein